MGTAPCEEHVCRGSRRRRSHQEFTVEKLSSPAICRYPIRLSARSQVAACVASWIAPHGGEKSADGRLSVQSRSRCRLCPFTLERAQRPARGAKFSVQVVLELEQGLCHRNSGKAREELLGILGKVSMS